MGIKIVNIFALADYGTKLNLDLGSQTLRNPHFRRGLRGSVFYQLPRSRVLLRVLRSGKVRVTGAQSRLEITEALSALTRALRRAGIRVNEPHIEIRNFVAVVDLQKTVNPDIFVREHPDIATYEPEQFPGLILRIASGATVLVFSSGKAVITGVSDEGVLLEAARSLRDLVSWK